MHLPVPNKKSEPVQVATLLTATGEDARNVYLRLDDETNKNKIEPALPQFANYCQPRKNIPFDHYHFNKQAKEAAKSYDQYKTALRQLPKGCEFTTITPEETLVAV